MSKHHTQIWFLNPMKPTRDTDAVDWATRRDQPSLMVIQRKKKSNFHKLIQREKTLKFLIISDLYFF